MQTEVVSSQQERKRYAIPLARVKRNAQSVSEERLNPWIVGGGRLALLLVILVTWEITTRLGIVSSFFFSRPSEIWATWIKAASEGSLWSDILYTFQSTIFGFIIGTCGGALIGLSFWWSRYYARMMEPCVIMFEAMPKLALAPIVVLIFGLGLASKIAIAVAITIVITLLTTYNGIKQVDKDLVRMVYSLGATKMQVFKKVIVPSTLPNIISALRINIGLALTGAIVGEYIGSTQGLGRMIFYAGQTYEISLIWVGIFNLSLLSMLLYLLIGWLESKLLKGMLHNK